MVPSPGPNHQNVCSPCLARCTHSSSLGKVMIAPLDVVLSDEDVLQPDIMFVSAQRLSIITDRDIKGPPDLVVEPLNYCGSLTLPRDQEPQTVRLLGSVAGRVSSIFEKQEATVRFDGEVAGSREWRGIDVRIVERLKYLESTFVTSGIPVEGVDLAWRINADKYDGTAAGVLSVRPNDKRITGEKGFTLTMETPAGS